MFAAFDGLVTVFVAYMESFYVYIRIYCFSAAGSLKGALEKEREILNLKSFLLVKTSELIIIINSRVNYFTLQVSNKIYKT